MTHIMLGAVDWIIIAAGGLALAIGIPIMIIQEKKKRKERKEEQKKIEQELHDQIGKPKEEEQDD